MSTAIQPHSLPNFAPVNSTFAAHPVLAADEQSTVSKLDLPDVNLFVADNDRSAGKTLLVAPRLPLDKEQTLNGLDDLEKPENKERLDDLPFILALTPAKIEHALSVVLQRELAAATVRGDDRTVLNVSKLQHDHAEQKHLAAAVPYLLATAAINGTVTTPLGPKGPDENKTDTPDPIKASEFVGFSNNSTMSFLLSMLRQVMAEINFSERKIIGMFAKLSSEMTEAASASTIREGKEIYNSAVKGFATSMAIAGGGALLQARGLHKQNQAVKKHLEPANQHRADAHQLQKNMHQTAASANSNRTHTGPNGEAMTHANMPSETEQAQFKQEQQAQINDKHRDAELEGQKYEQKTNKHRTHTSLAEQFSRTSDNAGQLANSSNKLKEKEAEADKMMESNISDIARSIVGDKDKNIEKEQEMVKEMRRNISEMRDSTVRANQSIVKG